MGNANPGTGGKVCIVCHQDCSNKPRTKDQAGRYTCQACYDVLAAKAKARPDSTATKSPQPKPAQPKPAHAKPADTPFDADDDALDLAGLASAVSHAEATAPAIAAPAMASTCPSCSSLIVPGAVICMNCGYNTHSKQKSKLKVTKAKKEKSGAAKAAGAMASELSIIIGWCVGGLLAAGIGVAVWAGIALSTGYESSLVGIGIGALTGIGVTLGGRGSTNFMSGLLAVIAAGVGIWGGHLYAAKEIVKRETAALRAEITASDDDALLELADRFVLDRVNRGQPVEWPSGVTGSTAASLADYPPDAVVQAKSQYESMSGAERVRLRESIEERIKTEFDAEVERAGDEFAADSFFPNRDGLTSRRAARGFTRGLLIAAIVAFLLGAGNDIRDLLLGS